MRFGAMTAPDVARIRELVKRLDELCREAAEIRDALVQAQQNTPLWPAPSSASQLSKKSSRKGNFLPTSADRADS
jgi:hypothetical protein